MKNYSDLTPEQVEKRRGAKRRYAERNAESEKIRKAEWQKTERAAQIKKEWKQKNITAVRESDAVYRANNKDKIAASSATWRKQNPHKVNAKTAKYRSNKLNATPGWANRIEIEKVYLLAKDLTELSGVEHNVDHVVPLQSDRVCGLHCLDNLQVIPRIDNTIKHNRYWPGMP